MTETVDARLKTPLTDKVAGLITGLLIAGVLTTAMFWSLQKLIKPGDTNLSAISPKVILDMSGASLESPIRGHPLPVKRQLASQRPLSPKFVNTNLSETLEISNGVESVKAPSKPSVSGGFSLGVGEGDYLPVIKVYRSKSGIYERSRAKRRIFRLMDGFCAVQNPAIRPGEAKDSTIVKGNCSTRSNG